MPRMFSARQARQAVAQAGEQSCSTDKPRDSRSQLLVSVRLIFSEDKISNGKGINPGDSRGLRRQLDGLDGYEGLRWPSGNNQKSTSRL